MDPLQAELRRQACGNLLALVGAVLIRAQPGHQRLVQAIACTLFGGRQLHPLHAGRCRVACSQEHRGQVAALRGCGCARDGLQQRAHLGDCRGYVQPGCGLRGGRVRAIRGHVLGQIHRWMPPHQVAGFARQPFNGDDVRLERGKALQQRLQARGADIAPLRQLRQMHAPQHQNRRARAGHLRIQRGQVNVGGLRLCEARQYERKRQGPSKRMQMHLHSLRWCADAEPVNVPACRWTRRRVWLRCRSVRVITVRCGAAGARRVSLPRTLGNNRR